MRIAVASGKGGTGKTTVAVNLAVAASMAGNRVQLLDCDVEEPNCHIFLSPDFQRQETVRIPVPAVREKDCSRCGICGQVCAFHAIFPGPKRVLVFPELCHGCGACSYLCPEKCIEEVPRPIGVIEEGTASLDGREIMFAHGALNTGEALASPLVKEVRKKALAHSLVIVDSPPGTSCTMVQSVKGSDLCILVTEPTPFGLHDLLLAYETAVKLGVPVVAVINRSDIGDDRGEHFCESHGIPVIMRIPLDKRLAKMYAEGRILVTSSEEYAQMFRVLHAKVLEALQNLGVTDATRLQLPEEGGSL